MAKQREIEGISAQQPFAAAGAQVVETRAGELLQHSEGVLDMAEIEGVHNMRVATRRLRAALEVFAPCFPARAYKPLLKEVKAIADALGERRDRDVAIAELETFAESMARPDRPGITSLIERYRDEQQRANDDLAPFVTEQRLQRLHGAALALAAEAREAAGDQPLPPPGTDGAAEGPTGGEVG